MDMLVSELGKLSEEPLAWGAVAILAAFALWSVWHWRACPMLREARVTEGDADAAIRLLEAPRVDGARYLVTMLGGIAATVTGLAFICEGIYPGAAFYLLLGGLFVIQTEPARREIRLAELRALAARRGGPYPAEEATDRLRMSHLALVAIHFILLAGAVAGLLAF